MGTTAPESLIERFSKLEDPRVDRNKKHELIDVIVLRVCAVVRGAEGWSDIEELGRTKLGWLRRYVPLASQCRPCGRGPPDGPVTFAGQRLTSPLSLVRLDRARRPQSGRTSARRTSS